LALPAVDELAETENDVEIIWRAFELRPKPAPLPDAMSDYFKQMWGNSIYPLAEKLGVKIKMPTVKPYSRITHEAAKWAESSGNFDEFSKAVFRAYFNHGEDIGKMETLLSLAENLQLETDSLQNALETNEFLESVLADENAAAEMGIGGVPAFVADRKAGLTGLQTVEKLRKLIESVRNNKSK
jgi:predicted DsbA family dithiol-disulfide isomerase